MGEFCVNSNAKRNSNNIIIAVLGLYCRPFRSLEKGTEESVAQVAFACKLEFSSIHLHFSSVVRHVFVMINIVSGLFSLLVILPAIGKCILSHFIVLQQLSLGPTDRWA